MMKTAEGATRTRIVGHRGAAKVLPENGVAGFRLAMELGVDAVELDVQVSADGALVVAHDPWLERVAESRGTIAHSTYSELACLRLKSDKGQGLADLPSVLDILRGDDCEIHVELKRNHRGEAYPELVERIVELLEKTGTRGRAILTSFFPDDLEKVRAYDSGLPLLASVNLASCSAMGGLQATVERFLTIDHDCVVAFEHLLLRHNFDLCTGLLSKEKIGAWVVNDAEGIDEWLQTGIRQITTDRPDLALERRAIQFEELES